MIDSNAIVAQLQEMRLFGEFNETEIETLVSLSETRETPAGDCIVRQDEPGDLMFVIAAGSAVVKHRQGDQDIELARLGAGDFFGEIALVDEGPRSATVEALTPCTLLCLSQGSVRALAGVHPSAAFKLLLAVGRVLVERLRIGNRKYIDSLLVKPG